MLRETRVSNLFSLLDFPEPSHNSWCANSAQVTFDDCSTPRAHLYDALKLVLHPFVQYMFIKCSEVQFLGHVCIFSFLHVYLFSCSPSTHGIPVPVFIPRMNLPFFGRAIFSAQITFCRLYYTYVPYCDTACSFVCLPQA